MNRGRKILKQGASEQNFRLKECLSIRNQVVSLRGSYQTEIMDAKRENSLALLPKSMWIGRAVTQQKRRRRRRRRRRGRVMCEIPRDLIIEILMRLPVKSLMRFKCVSKQWSSLISCRYFCNRVFTTVARQQQPRLYMSLVGEGGEQRVLLSMSSTSPDNTCFVVDRDLSIPGMGGYLLDVVHGLMSFSVKNKPYIYNPSTKQLLTLPAIKSDIIAEQGQRTHLRCYIGHDPVNDQYTLFCTIAVCSAGLANLKSEHWIFVLEAGGLWKKVVPLKNYQPHAPLALGWSISGSVVHYMAWLDMYICVLVSFDIRSEQLTFIPLPAEVGDVFLPAVMMKADLIEYGGEIAIFDHSHLKDEGLVDLWVLKDAGKKKWSRKTLALQPCQRHLFHDTELIIKGTTQDGKIVLAPTEMCSGFYILYYDMQSNYLTRVEIKGVPHFWFDNECYLDLKFVDESESFIYLET